MGKKLTTWQAACIITGYGVGKRHHDATVSHHTRGHCIRSLAILLLAFFFSYCMHMMLAELTMGVGKGTRIVGIFQHYLFPRTLWQGAHYGHVRAGDACPYLQSGCLCGRRCGDSCLCGIAAPSRQDSLLRHCRRRGLFRAESPRHQRGHLDDIIIGIIVILAAGSMFPPGQRHLLRCRKLLGALGVFRHGHDVFSSRSSAFRKRRRP